MSKNESGEDTWFWMTREQRHEHKYKIWTVIYLLGCIFLYFGIPQSLFDSFGTHELTYQPEKDIFHTLLNAVLALSRPVIAFYICALPIGLLWGLWLCCHDFFTKNQKNRKTERP